MNREADTWQSGPSLTVRAPITPVHLARLLTDCIFVQITSVVEVARVGRKTPMAVILQEWGVEPDLKYLS